MGEVLKRKILKFYPVNFTVREDYRDKLEAICEEQDTTITNIMRQMIEEYLETYEREVEGE